MHEWAVCSFSIVEYTNELVASVATARDHELRPRTHGNVFLRFCIVSSNKLVNNTKTQGNVSVCTRSKAVCMSRADSTQLIYICLICKC